MVAGTRIVPMSWCGLTMNGGSRSHSFITCSFFSRSLLYFTTLLSVPTGGLCSRSHALITCCCISSFVLLLLSFTLRYVALDRPLVGSLSCLPATLILLVALSAFACSRPGLRLKTLGVGWEARKVCNNGIAVPLVLVSLLFYLAGVQ